MLVETKIDKLAELAGKMTRLSDLAKKLSWPEESVEKISLILEKAGLAKMSYPITMVEEPSVILLPQQPTKKPDIEKGKVLKEYTITSREGRTSGDVVIVQSEKERRPRYILTLGELSPFTRAYLEEIKVEVSKRIPVYGEEKSSEEIKAHFDERHKLISEVVSKDLLPDADTIESICKIAIAEMYGLGELEALIGDSNLEEIVINESKQPVSVYHRKLGWLKTNLVMENETDIENYAQQIARRVGRQISTLNPILDAHLGTGDRVNATLSPISALGNTITLRLFARDPWTLPSFLKEDNNSMSIEMGALLWQAMHYEMNIIVAGGTASGKTSALNGLLCLIPPFQRIVTIEDTRELQLPSYQWNWVPMLSRTRNPEGFGEVTMLDLMVNSLRMRPDRIVMGEIRRKNEAEVFFEAMHTGHSVYSTIHADTSAQVIKRLIEPPIEVPKAEVEDIHLLLVQYRDRRRNIRRTLEISEVISGGGAPEANRLFSWKPRTDTFESSKNPHRYMEEMNLHTGMTEAEIRSDQDDKAAVLGWMLKNDLVDIESVGKVMKSYYADESTVVAAARKGTNPSKVL